jgi:hypothetical protein
MRLTRKGAKIQVLTISRVIRQLLLITLYLAKATMDSEERVGYDIQPLLLKDKLSSGALGCNIAK